MHGEEVTPGAAAPTKGHATLDVALAFAGYVHATGDLDYLDRVAWPVIAAVAEWVESRVDRSPRGYEIRDMSRGPPKQTPHARQQRLREHGRRQAAPGGDRVRGAARPRAAPEVAHESGAASCYRG